MIACCNKHGKVKDSHELSWWRNSSWPLQGTLKVEVPLASGVSGVVTRDAKGSGQGTITITDGNNLDMPADVRFPKARDTEAVAKK